MQTTDTQHRATEHLPTMSQTPMSQWSLRGQFDACIATAEEMDRAAAKRGEAGVLAPRESVAYVERDLSVRIEHPGGGTATLLVCARRLWPGGIAALYPGYVHVNSECWVVMPRVDMSPMEVEGVVRACRHVSGTIHDLSIEFSRQLELKRFLKDPALLASLTTDKKSVAPLSGMILYSGRNLAKQMLMRYHLQKTGATLTCFSESGPALDALRKDEARCILCEFDTPGINGEKLIQDLVEVGSGAPIVAMVTDAMHGSAAREAGADTVITKPYERATLVGTLTGLLDRDGDGDRGPIRSSLGADADAREAIEAYIEYAGHVSAQIREAIKRDDFMAVRAGVATLRGTGESFGFETLSKAGTEALTQLDGSGSIKESRRALEHLMSAVRRLEFGQAA